MQNGTTTSCEVGSAKKKKRKMKVQTPHRASDADTEDNKMHLKLGHIERELFLEGCS